MPDPNRLSRRNFLQGVGAFGLLGPLLGSPLGGLFSENSSFSGKGAQKGRLRPEPLPERPPGSAQNSVIVIGAGLSGLAAAWELADAGHEVTVLEAKSRPGGRVHTLREPFADDLYAEAGAVAFSETYAQAGRYIDELGLERADWAQPDLPALYHVNGERLTVGGGEPTDWPYDLSEEEQGLGPMGLMKKYFFGTLPEEISEPERWNEPPLSELDKVSLAEYLRKQGASQGAIDLIADTQFFGWGIDRTSTLSSALAEFGLFFGGTPFVLKGGNDRLPSAMAQRLGQSVHYGVEATRLQSTEQGVEVRAERMGRAQTYEADWAVCAVPLGVLKDLDVTPQMPQEKQRAVQEVPYVDATRTFLQVGRAFWYDEGVAGMASTDLPVGIVYRHPWEDAAGPDERAILEGYAIDEAAAEQAARPKDELVKYILKHMEEVHPGIGEHVEGAVVKAWGEDPHAQGHVSWPRPGDVTTHLEMLQEPHGRIHFAGEHTTVLRGTMEGALRSGVHAAREIDEAAGG